LRGQARPRYTSVEESTRYGIGERSGMVGHRR
jgi:hypothetical protein